MTNIMMNMSRSVKLSIIFLTVGIAIGISAFYILSQDSDSEIQQRAVSEEDGDPFDALSIEERAKRLAYLSVGIYYKHRLAVDEEFPFTAAAKGGKPPYEFEWKFSDGAIYSVQNITRSFAAVGNYTGEFTATDSAGDSRSNTFRIQVIEPSQVHSSSSKNTPLNSTS